MSGSTSPEELEGEGGATCLDPHHRRCLREREDLLTQIHRRSLRKRKGASQLGPALPSGSSATKRERERPSRGGKEHVGALLLLAARAPPRYVGERGGSCRVGVRHFRGRARCFRGEKERRVRLSDGNERE